MYVVAEKLNVQAGQAPLLQMEEEKQKEEVGSDPMFGLMFYV